MELTRAQVGRSKTDEGGGEGGEGRERRWMRGGEEDDDGAGGGGGGVQGMGVYRVEEKVAGKRGMGGRMEEKRTGKR